jgi:hypothetical protein
VERHQAVVVQVEGAEGARVPHHDVLQLGEPVVAKVEVLQLSEAAERLRLDFRDAVVLERFYSIGVFSFTYRLVLINFFKLQCFASLLKT